MIIHPIVQKILIKKNISIVSDLQSFSVLLLFPQGLSHLFFPNFTVLLWNIYQNRTLVLFTFGKRLIGFAIFAFIMRKVDSVRTTRMNLSLCNSGIVG